MKICGGYSRIMTSVQASHVIDQENVDDIPRQAEVSQHPVLQHKLALIRRKEGTAREFRALFREITFYLGYEATRDLATHKVDVCYRSSAKTTPVSSPTEPIKPVCQGHKIAEKVALVPILRGGLGMSESFLELLPNAPMYHIGMYRNTGSLIPVQYYNRLPKGKPSDVAVVLDPIIASSRTICAVVSIVKKWGAKKVKVVSLVASKCGVQALAKQHPDVQIYLASIDTLAENGVDLVPGIGDAGDRLYLGLNSEDSSDKNLLPHPRPDSEPDNTSTTNSSDNNSAKRARIGGP